MTHLKKYKFIDLFAGCGGLQDGFLQTGHYVDVASVEWLKPQVDTLRNRLSTKWEVEDSDKKVLYFDIQREEELFNGWKDTNYGENEGLDHLVNEANGIDIVIGGPPCQAYSVAGRVRDENGMKNDYRNYLFEHYLSVVNRYQPKLFVFENVPGILSATPEGIPITTLIREGFERIGYEISNDLKNDAKIDASLYGVPQVRQRVIIVGIRKDLTPEPQTLLKLLYKTILPKYKTQTPMTVREAIGDLPKIFPKFDSESHANRDAYTIPQTSITWHSSRYHSLRDMETFRLIARDLESGEKKLQNSKALTKIYEERVGSKSPIHRYHVLNPDEPSTTIIAHLYKDGNRFIHYDSQQSRTITVRETARLQSFDDDFDFIGSRGSAYQMIGNAVPPQLAKRMGLAIAELLEIL